MGHRSWLFPRKRSSVTLRSLSKLWGTVFRLLFSRIKCSSASKEQTLWTRGQNKILKNAKTNLKGSTVRRFEETFNFTRFFKLPKLDGKWSKWFLDTSSSFRRVHQQPVQQRKTTREPSSFSQQSKIQQELTISCCFQERQLSDFRPEKAAKLEMKQACWSLHETLTRKQGPYKELSKEQGKGKKK